MNKLLKYTLLYEGLIQLKEASERGYVYQLAEQKAKELNKPLIVVGGPEGGNYILKQILKYTAHGCGDVCVDIDPKACVCSNFPIVASVTNIPLPDKYGGAVYVAHVLEHLPTIYDAQLAWQELNRIADYVFIIYPDKLSISAWLHPDHHLWVYEQNGQVVFEQR